MSPFVTVTVGARQTSSPCAKHRLTAPEFVTLSVPARFVATMTDKQSQGRYTFSQVARIKTGHRSQKTGTERLGLLGKCGAMQAENKGSCKWMGNTRMDFCEF